MEKINIDNRNIAQLSDFHVRFGSRHDEIKTVFNRVIKNLQKQKPRRIVITGDLFHLKINLSPIAIEIVANFLLHLSKIAPVDIILGNHDLNEQDLSQGNSITPLINLMSNGVIVGLSCVDCVKNYVSTGNYYGVFFYTDSGFYEVDDEIVYGVYSLLDNKILTLKEKIPGKKYVALYHGQIQGSLNDNGFTVKGDDLLKLSVFNNFDIVMLGDIHEHQAFKRDGIESSAYSGSILQNTMGESIKKGYLFWNLDSCTFDFIQIPNDYGFCKINISQGEDVWQSIDDSIRLSENPKKTKVWVELMDDTENENIELKSQIRKYVKSKYKCESVDVEFKRIIKEKVFGVNTDNMDLSVKETFREILSEFIKENGYDNIDDVLSFSDDVDKELNLIPKSLPGVEWDLNKFVTYNIFSHPAKETIFDVDKMGGITGFFGKNYTGKSNIIKAFVWGSWGKILGGGDAHKVINMYTGIKNAYVHIYFTILGTEFRSKRGIEITVQKNGNTKAINPIEYDYAVKNDNGEMVEWVPVESDRAAKEKKEAKKMIEDTLGTFENFTKISLQTQGGKDDYLSLLQQPKNDLIREYMNLSSCDVRHDLVNKKFNKIKNIQSELGKPDDIETEIIEAKNKVETENILINNYNEEKTNNTEQIDLHNNKILEYTKTLIKTEGNGHSNKEGLTMLIKKESNNITSLKQKIKDCEDWQQKNLLKEIPNGIDQYTIEGLESDITCETKILKSNQERFNNGVIWLKENVKKPELSIIEHESEIDTIKEKISKLKNETTDLTHEITIAKGKECPLCHHVSEKPNLEKELSCVAKIKNVNKEIILLEDQIKNNQVFIKNQKDVSAKNLLIEKAMVGSESIKNTIDASGLKIEQLKLILEKLNNSIGDIEHNKKVRKAIDETKSVRDSLEKSIESLNTYKSQLEILIKNESAIIQNKEINENINHVKESIKEYKLLNYNLDERIKNSFGTIRVQESNITNLEDKLKQIKESVRIFKKYSVYLQSVSREGIPAQIIKKRLPIVNSKINNILRSVVNFKIEMYSDPKGDVKEIFYFNEDKSDALPLSMASGSQKFISSIAIRDALHYVSCLVKPSFCIIDEGFGTLDDEKIGEIGNVFNYLKNKYKSVWIITHKNEIKDLVDNQVLISKTQTGLTQEQIENNPEAGISQFSFS